MKGSEAIMAKEVQANKKGKASPRINQHDILDVLHKRYNEKGMRVTRAQIGDFYTDFVHEVLNELHKGNDVTLTRLLQFEHVDVDAHKGRNPSTGETIDVPARRVVKIRPRIHIRDLISEFDSNGNVLRSGDEHPAVVKERKNDTARHEREAAFAAKREENAVKAAKRKTEQEHARRSQERERDLRRQLRIAKRKLRETETVKRDIRKQNERTLTRLDRLGTTNNDVESLQAQLNAIKSK